ncbi:MAG TPA: hypothetical protein VN408_41280 [Actinoplanes sp.]|nr:hypothetical protein [Actinoplanes sp.]
MFDSPGDTPPVIGGIADTASRLGAAHAIGIALCGRATVVTSRPGQIRSVLGDDRTILEVQARRPDATETYVGMVDGRSQET